MLADIDHGCEWCRVAPAIWQIVHLEQPYSWSVGPASRQRLSDLIPPDEFTALVAANDAALINRNLRVTLAPHLAGQDRQHAVAVALWIVRYWGGIRRGSEQTIIDWSGALGHYGDVAVNSFIGRQKNYRVSSWSKLLAFADHANHAIYDARTTVALNCALAQVQDPRRFHMPASRNNLVRKARCILLQDANTKPRGYRCYLNLLRCFVAGGGPANLLCAEMTLFANALNVAETFVAQSLTP
jgi:hypothetical protein